MKEVIYTAVFLTAESAEELKEWANQTIGELLPKTFCHHMTVAFRPKDGLGDLVVGQEVELKVVAVAGDDKGQAVEVVGFDSNNAVPHITISCAEGVSPVYSNELLAARIAVEGPTLKGVVGYFDGKSKQFEVHHD